MESIKAMNIQVGDLCFTPDGIAKKGLLVRHLVMPGYESEGVKIMKWMADNVSRDVFVNIMEQYHPSAHVGKFKSGRSSTASTELGGHAMDKQTMSKVRYGEINRPITKEELSTVRIAAERAGLWRFCDPPRHDGFSL